MDRRKSNPKRRWEKALSNKKTANLIRKSWNAKDPKEFYKKYLLKKI
jgi:hypothetical protein